MGGDSPQPGGSGDLTAVWRFQPRAAVDPRRDEASERRNDLLAALRAGHGSGVRFSLRLDSGPDPTLRLLVPDPTSARWAARVLVPSFPMHHWTRDAALRARPPERSRGARRIRPWPHPFRTPMDGPPLLDHLARAMATLPRGVALTVTAAPLPASLPRWWERSAPLPDGGAPRPFPPGRIAGVPGRSPAPAREWVERPLFWSLRVTLELACDIAGGGSALSVGPAIERSSFTALGNGLTFTGGFRGGPIRAPGFPVSEEELVLVLPGPECPAAGESDRTAISDSLWAFGRTSPGEIVGPVLEPHQGRHVAVLGETGMGKSSMLVALARRASRGSGLLLLDPLGETAEALVRELEPEAVERTVRIDPILHPVPINALEGIGPTGHDPVRSERRLNDLVHALRRVRAGRYTDSAYWGPRLEEMLTRAVRAAASLDGGTLTDAHTLLATGARLHREVPTEAIAPVRELADRIRERPEDAEGARRLIYEVVRSPVLERMLCSRTPELVTRELVAPGRLAILSGTAARVGESTARYLLSVYLALIWSELLARPSNTKTFVVLDEAQWFSHESLAEMLRLGRRANVHVVLATQAIASLPESVAEAVWTNVSDFVAFRGSPEEAREFSRAARGLSTEAILSLPRGHAAVLLGKGQTVRWLRTVRIPSPAVEKVDVRTPVGEADRSPTDRSSGWEVSSSRSTETDRGAPPGPSATTSLPRPTDSDVLLFLRRRALEQPSGKPWRISLEDLRREVDPEGRAVRAAGTILGRSGALLATERTERGTVWVLAPERIEPRAADGRAVVPGNGSRTPQPY